jgi:hypothetical protein
LERHDDELGDAIAEVDVVCRDARDAPPVEGLRYGLPGSQDAASVAVPLGVTDVLDDVIQHVLGCVEAERGRVAKVELDDLVASGLKLASSPKDRSAYVVPDVAEPACLSNLHLTIPPLC